MSSFTKQLSISILISYTLSITAWYLYSHYKNKKNEVVPRKWKRIGTVEKIILYPLKSAALKEVTSAECKELGLREVVSSNAKYLFQDRSFVVYDENNNKALNLNKYPTIVLICVDSEDLDHVVFKAPGVEDFSLTLSEILSRNHVMVNSCKNDVLFDAIDCGNEAAKWFSNFLTNGKENYRLGYYAEDINQRPDPIGTTLKVKGFSSMYKHWRKNDGGTYVDLSSYMLVTSSSIEDANEKLKPEDKFFYGHLRPNIVVTGCQKYSEDKWKWIKIGEKVVLRTIKPCTRCHYITVNPNTGQRNRNMEPLKTLKSYRTVKQLFGHDLQGNQAVLGINAGLYEPGEIHINDPVYINL